MDGKLVAINAGSNALQATVDPQMLKDAGITPKQDWTFADWDAMGAQLKAKGKLIAADLRHDVYFPFYLRSQARKCTELTALHLVTPTTNRSLISTRCTKNGMIPDTYCRWIKLAQKKGTPEDDEMALGNAVSSNGWSNQYIAC